MLLNSIALLVSLALVVFLAGRGTLFSRAHGDAASGRARFLVTLFRLALFVAVAASAALVVDYQNAGDPAFCGVTSGCFAVRVSPYSKPFGVPLPNIGLAIYASLLGGSLLSRTRTHHALLAAAAGLGGVIATVLLFLQAYTIQAFCAWCVAVDISALVAAFAAALLLVQALRMPPDAFERAASGGLPITTTWGVAALIAMGLPLLWARYPVVPPLPPDIAALQAPGKITVVGFTDFQCPFCRKLHPEIEKLKEQYGERLVYHRKMVPLPNHPGALPAAQAYVCTPEAKREQAAALLYAASPEQLTEAGIAGLFAPIGADGATLAACMRSTATQVAIAADVAMYERLAARGLPLTFAGGRVVTGYNPERIREALRREAEGDHTSLPLPWMLAALVAVAALAVALDARSRGRAPDEGGDAATVTQS